MDDVAPWTLGGSYHLRMGGRKDCKSLLLFMQQAYREQSSSLKGDHLIETVRQLWSEETPVWFVVSTTVLPEDIGCLWLGNAIDQVTGDRYTHIFLLYINPNHRRCGLGRHLMKHAETWSIQQGYPQIGLHVFADNQPAQSLYQKLGYYPEALTLKKSLQNF